MPTTDKIAALLLACLLPCGIARGYEAGTEYTIDREGLTDPLKLFVPDNYRGEKAAPIIFYYPGTSGRPNFGVLLEATGRRDFVLVGMAYPAAGRLDGSEDGLKAALDEMFAVRDFLGKRLNLDEKRVYIGGASKGGWMASMSSEFGLGRIRGALILGAGKTARAPDLRPEVAKKRPAGSYPIYVGIGQWDGNYVSSVRCIRHFSEIGGRVTFDTYPGLGHKIDTSEYLQQWLAVEAAGNDEATVRRKALGWWMKKRGELKKQTELNRYLMLKHAARAPFAAFLDDGERKEISDMLEVVVGAAGLAEELNLEKKFLAILASELEDGTLPNVMTALRSYRDIALESPDLHFGREAYLQWIRCHSVMVQTLDYPLEGLKEMPGFDGLPEKVAALKPPEDEAARMTAYFIEIGERNYGGPDGR